MVESTARDPVTEVTSGEHSQHITEDEASLYDRQIRLWGLEAQNRMRSSTVLLLSLRSLGHETIKNLVLAGIGRLIVMDDGVVTVDDLSSGFLFREEDGALGQPRSTAAAPQIESLNPLVSLTALPTMTPFVRDPTTAAAVVNTKTEMIDFLKREKVDVIVGCDLKRDQMISIDDAARDAGVMFYAAGTYGFYGYVFADLGKDYEYVFNPPSSSTNPTPAMSKKKLSYSSFAEVLDDSEWYRPAKSETGSRSPFRDLTRNQTKERDPLTVIAILALWEYEKRYDSLPSDGSKKRRCGSSDQGDYRRAPGATGTDEAPEDNQQDVLPTWGYVTEDESNYRKIYTEIQVQLGLHPKLRGTDRQAPLKESEMISQLSKHADLSFPPTLAILGGLLAQDVLRALSKKDKPIVNLLAVDSMGGSGSVNRWSMVDAVDA